MAQTSVEWLVENAEDFFGHLLAPSIQEQAKEMHKAETFDFSEWLLSHEVVYLHDTEEGKIYDYYCNQLSMAELHEIYLKQK